MVDLISNIYTRASTVVRTPAGPTSEIPVLSGVKQECPLSPILFNLTVEIILRSVLEKAQSIGPAKHYGHPIYVLAYADDLVLITRNAADLQKLLDAASETATLTGLEFRSHKCASLSATYSRHKPTNIGLNEFLVRGQVMPPLDQNEHYRYLGVPIGVMRDVDSIDKLVNELCEDLKSINQSLLTPWQKIDSIRTFVQPSLTFALRAGEPEKQSLRKYHTSVSCSFN